MFSSQKSRQYTIQILLLLALVGLFLFLTNNAIENMATRNIKGGFDFLDVKAGFAILFSPFIDYNASVNTYFDTFLVGLGNTILVSVLGIITATIVGFIFGVARLSQNWLVAKIASAYVEIFRNIPLLLQISFWYFAIMIPLLPSPRQSITLGGDWLVMNNRGFYIPEPTGDGFSLLLYALIFTLIVIYLFIKWANRKQAQSGKIIPKFWLSVIIFIALPSMIVLISGTDITLDFPQKGKFAWRGGWVIIPELAALWLALTIYTGAFIAENIRGGILAVNKGQTEASLALGLSRSQTLRLVVIPQALRVIIPPQTSQYLNLTKNSSLAAAVGYPDLVAVFAGTALNQIGRAIEIISMTMLVYLSLSLTISVLMNIYNSRMALKER